MALNVWKRITPFACHNQDRVLVQFGANQWVHLGHVAAEPEQPASGRGQYQNALDNSSVGAFGSNDWQSDANHAKNRGKNDDG